MQKCKDFFADAERVFKEDSLRSRGLIWLQGESDAADSSVEYETKLGVLWEAWQKIGFTHFFCIRVDYFGADGIKEIIRAQENFVSRHKQAYMLTRSASYFTYPEQNEKEWFVSEPRATYRNCRDGFYGFNNHHVNEKGFSVIAERTVENLYRVLTEGKQPSLEAELVRGLVEDKE